MLRGRHIIGHTGGRTRRSGPPPLLGAFRLLARESDGLALSFVDQSANVKDTVTMANAYNSQGFATAGGDLIGPAGLITYSSPSAKMCRQADGLLKYGAHNLLTYSEQFDNAAWTKTRSSITANATTAPDGTTTADKLVEDGTASNTHFVSRSYTWTATPYTVSVYAKADTRDDFRISVWDGTTTHSAFFALDTGTVGTLSGTGAGTIEALADGWYRCEMTFTPAAASGNFNFVLAIAESQTYTGDGTSGLYIWGAQLCRAPAIDTYIKTTTAAVYQLPYTYDINGNCEGILVEQQSTNLVTYSEQFDNAAWTNVGANITANAATAPDGTSTADLFNNAAGAGESLLRSAAGSVGANSTVTSSVFVKNVDAALVRLDANFAGGTPLFGGVEFTFATETFATVSGSTATVVDYDYEAYTNGWYRIWVTVTDTGSNTVCHLDVRCDPYSSSDENIYIWGAQLEVGVVPTSYIQTVAATVTRAFDNIAVPTTAFKGNEPAATVYVHAKHDNPSSGSLALFEMSDGTYNERFLAAKADGDAIYTRVFTGAASQCFLAVAGATGVFKFAAAAADDDMTSFIDGTANAVPDTDGDVATPSAAFTEFRIGSIPAAGSDTAFNGIIKSIMHVPRRMSDTELAEITS